MIAETADHMMVLAVNVIGDGSADRDEFRAGRDRQEPSAANDQIEDFRQGDAGFALENSGRLIERQKMVHPASVQENAIRVQAAVAIAAAIPMNEHWLARSRKLRVSIGNSNNALPHARKSAPGCSDIRHQIALMITRPQIANTTWLTRSVAANTTGSSFITPRWATTHTRLTQYSSSGHSNHNTCGLEYSARLSGLLM